MKLPCIIDDNKPRCPYCNNEVAPKIIDVDVAIVDGERHFEMEVRCNKCTNKSYYFLDLDLEERKSVDKKSDRFQRVVTDDKVQFIESEESV